MKRVLPMQLMSLWKQVTSLLNWAKLGVAQIERLDSGRSSYVRYPDVRCLPVYVDAPSRSQLLNPIVFLLVDPPPRPGFIDLFSNTFQSSSI